MVKIIQLILAFFLLLSFNSCNTTKNISVKEENKLVKNKNLISKNALKKGKFPEDWAGNYQGDLEIYSVDSIAMKLKMKLDITKKTDSIYNWTITYIMKDKEPNIRAYELNIVNSKAGHYIIDEKNSIKIDAFYRNKIFTSFFKVMNSFIVATYTKENDAIIFEIISSSDKKPSITGNTKQGKEDIPEVITYFVDGRQKAILKRVAN